MRVMKKILRRSTYQFNLRIVCQLFTHRINSKDDKVRTRNENSVLTRFKNFSGQTKAGLSIVALCNITKGKHPPNRLTSTELRPRYSLQHMARDQDQCIGGFQQRALSY